MIPSAVILLSQAEEFRMAVQLLLEWLSEAEQTLRFRGVLPEEAETLQTLLHTHRNFMATVEEKRTDVNRAAGQGEAILTTCHADCITTIKHWITIIRARFEEVGWLEGVTGQGCIEREMACWAISSISPI